jgi:16S rRNA (cytidine1402-2'-O)-methyltransferase
MTLRGIRLLKEVDLILAEDTRTSQKLLNHYEIKTSMQSFHMHNEHKKVAQVIQEVLRGKTIALISDAGTPGISDPGYLLVHEALKQGVKVECLPGPTALIPALVQSGLPSDRFVFEGFLPPKKGRQGRLKQMAEESRTTVFYESPHKIIKTLGQMLPYFGPQRKLAVVRELSKKFESNFRGSLEEAVHFFEEHPPKGEFVIVVEGTKNK